MARRARAGSWPRRPEPSTMNARPDVPAGESAQDAQDAIAEEFSFFSDWTERYQYLIDLGRKLPPFPPELQTEGNKVHGCQSQVWLVAEGGREPDLRLAAVHL